MSACILNLEVINKYVANQGSRAFINNSKAGLSLLGQTF